MGASFSLPRLRPISPRRSVVMAALDVGTSKIICLIARLDPAAHPGRLHTHAATILGIGYQRSRGLKGGQIVDMAAAEGAIRLALDAAERMAGLQIENIVVSMAGGRIQAQHFEADRTVNGATVEDCDLHRVLESSFNGAAAPGRVVLHALPTDFTVDGGEPVRDPRGMIGAHLHARLHVSSCDAAAAANLRFAVERCHLGVGAFVAAPHAAGLGVLSEDELDMGATLIDFGGGTTSVSVFEGGALAHLDSIAVGGQHVTLDIARGLNVKLSAAEKLKCQSGAAQPTAEDSSETILVEPVGEEQGRPMRLPRAHLQRIIAPRVDEILELTRDRLRNAGFARHAAGPLTLTGGASLLAGLPEATRRVFGGPARIGRPASVEKLPDSGRSPAFAAAVGALVYPQAAVREHFEPSSDRLAAVVGGHGRIAKIGRWLKDSF